MERGYVKKVTYDGRVAKVGREDDAEIGQRVTVALYDKTSNVREETGLSGLQTL